MNKTKLIDEAISLALDNPEEVKRLLRRLFNSWTERELADYIGWDVS